MDLVLIIPLCHAFIFLGPGIGLSRFFRESPPALLWLLFLQEAVSQLSGSAGIHSWKSTEKFPRPFDLNVLRARFLSGFPKLNMSRVHHLI